jgi:hypothetical protein
VKAQGRFIEHVPIQQNYLLLLLLLLLCQLGN